MASAMLVLEVSLNGAPGSAAGSGPPGQPPAASHRSATDLASSQKMRPVLRLLKCFARAPAAMIGQEHRVHFLDRSSSSPEWESLGCFPSHCAWWRLYKLRAMMDPILHPRCTQLHAKSQLRL